MYDLIGLVNAVTDVIVPATDEEIVSLGFEKGIFKQWEDINYAGLLEMIKSNQRAIDIYPGGSAANVMIDAVCLFEEQKQMRNAALLGTVGTDNYGQKYKEYVKNSRVISLLSTDEGDSGVCYALVVPSGEKALTAKLNVAKNLSYDLYLLAENLSEKSLFHTTGYEILSNPIKTISTTVYMKQSSAKISFDVASPDAVKYQRSYVEQMIKNSDILFITEEEAGALLNVSPCDTTTYECLESIAKLCPTTILKRGKKGSIVLFFGEKYDIGAVPVKVVNTNGAGDAYAAGFLTKYLQGLYSDREWVHPAKCGEYGATIAGRVCEIEEGHLKKIV